jgi:hypothetical protein
MTNIEDVLRFDFHNVTGLELDGQLVGMHGYFPDPVSYRSLIKLRELRALASDDPILSEQVVMRHCLL